MSRTDIWHGIATSPSKPMHACHCVGPQNGQPLCPCRMGSVSVRDGRYVEVIDHGPAPKDDLISLNEIVRRQKAQEAMG